MSFSLTTIILVIYNLTTALKTSLSSHWNKGSDKFVFCPSKHDGQKQTSKPVGLQIWMFIFEYVVHLTLSQKL